MDRKLQGILPSGMVQAAIKAEQSPLKQTKRVPHSVEEIETGILEVNWCGNPSAILCVVVDEDEEVSRVAFLFFFLNFRLALYVSSVLR